MKDGASSLLNRLKEIQIERRRLLTEEESITARLQTLSLSWDTTPDDHSSGADDTTSCESFHRYLPGERVFIENKVKHIRHLREPEPKDRAAVVQRVRPDQVFLKTYNGHSTWRSPRNIRRLSEEEHAAISQL